VQLKAPRKIVFWEVDAQADFVLPGGKLYVPSAEKIIPNIKRLVDAAAETHTLLISSGDAHPEGDPEFEIFPPHCLRDTPGAQIIPEGMLPRFYVVPNNTAFALPPRILDYQQIVLQKQTFDVFDNPQTDEVVKRLGDDPEFVVFGVVTEYCVRCAAKGLLQRGRKVAVVVDAIETMKPEDGRRTLDELKTSGARLITTEEAIAAARSGPSMAKQNV
jgi:nicotinamidase/pyrazinamidase